MWEVRKKNYIVALTERISCFLWRTFLTNSKEIEFGWVAWGGPKYYAIFLMLFVNRLFDNIQFRIVYSSIIKRENTWLSNETVLKKMWSKQIDATVGYGQKVPARAFSLTIPHISSTIQYLHILGLIDSSNSCSLISLSLFLLCSGITPCPLYLWLCFSLHATIEIWLFSAVPHIDFYRSLMSTSLLSIFFFRQHEWTCRYSGTALKTSLQRQR